MSAFYSRNAVKESFAVVKAEASLVQQRHVFVIVPKRFLACIPDPSHLILQVYQTLDVGFGIRQVKPFDVQVQATDFIAISQSVCSSRLFVVEMRGQYKLIFCECLTQSLSAGSDMLDQCQLRSFRALSQA